MNLNNSIACLHFNEQYIGQKALSGLKIRQILASSSSGKELALDLSQKTTISSDYRDISVLLSYPCYDQPAIRFKFKLYANNQLLVEDSSFPSVHFGSLEFDTYTLWACLSEEDIKESLPILNIGTIIFKRHKCMAIKKNQSNI
mgnify:CR=1 FL=1